MNDIIRFKGLTLNRDEQGVERGEMSLCGGVEMHDGSLRASVLEGTKLCEGTSMVDRLIYVHQTAKYSNYIAINEVTVEGTLYTYLTYAAEYFDSHTGHYAWGGQAITQQGAFDTASIRSVNSVGNTLVIMNDAGLHYFVFRFGSSGPANIGTYVYLGQQPPFLELQFNLHQVSASAVAADNFKRHIFDFPDYDDVIEENWPTPDADGYFHLKSDAQVAATEAILGFINERQAEEAGNGKFYAPFLVRYCYRLFDGSMVMHSCPVMMFPMLKHPVYVVRPVDLSGDYGVAQLAGVRLFMQPCTLQVKCLNTSAITDLKKWGDIVKSVDIFVTPQQSRIDTSGMIRVVKRDMTIDDMMLVDGVMPDFQTKVYSTYGTPGGDDHLAQYELPEFGEEEYYAKIRNASAFFRLSSNEVENLSTLFTSSFKDVDMDVSDLRNIAVQRQMTDDYKTHNLLKPFSSDRGGMYVYNHRLNVYGISEQLFGGFGAGVMFPYCASGTSVTSIETCVSTDSGVRKVTSSGTAASVLSWLVSNGYCFYPDSRAVAMKIGSTVRKLASSGELNGALSFYPKTAMVSVPSGVIDDAVVPLVNKVYTSKADNPYYFPNLPDESGINTVGVGEIIGLAAVTRALTQGDVGDHDLAVFCTDGIWVLKVSPTGTYSNMHNISREVCVNKDSICQLDQSVIFGTERSLARFVEEDVKSVSDVLDGPFFSVRTKLPGLADAIGATSGTDAAMLIDFDTPHYEYWRTGRVLYDYTSRRIIVLRSNLSAKSVALVFSIRDQTWSTMVVPAMMAVINSYPCPYIQTTDGVVTRLDKPYDHTSAVRHSGIVVTRTLTFSDSMDLIRGFRQMTDSAVMPTMFFYGSDDQRTWKLIGSSAREFHNYMPGHPFRFFRIAISLSLLTSERYQQLVLEVINKYAKL